jgi:hypothetical protein
VASSSTDFPSSAARRAWLAWGLLCAAIVVLHALAGSLDRLAEQDEVQIVDLGRSVLQPGTDWALNWNVPAGTTLLPLSWLGVTLQEVAYQAGAPGYWGPRVAALGWTLLAGTAAFGWLRARGTPLWPAFLLAAAFLLDPMYAETWSAARIDGGAIAAVLTSCWLLRRAADQPTSDRRTLAHLVAAGALVAVSPFLWPTALMLVPLVIVEMHHLIEVVGAGLARDRGLSAATRPPTPLTRYRRTALSTGWPFLAGGAGAALLMLAPVLWQAQAYRDSLTAMAAVQAHAAVIQNPIHQLFLTHSPVIALVALVSLLWRREPGLLLALGAAVLLTYQTMVYPARVIYLLPYGLAMVAGACQVLATSEAGWLSRRTMNYLLALLLAWNATMVLVLRPLSAWSQRAADPQAVLLENLRAAIGPGAHRVLLEDWSSYYAARQLGWRSYRAGSPVTAERYAEFIATMEYVVVLQRPLYDTTRRLTRAAGFEHQATLTVRSAAGSDHTLEVYRRPAAD